MQVSRSESVELLTGAESHALRMRRHLEKLLVEFKLNGQRPAWFDDWVANKQVQSIHETSLLRYLEDMPCYGNDPALQSLTEIKQRLGFLSRTLAPSSYRRNMITVKQILKHLDREKDDEALRLPKKPEPRTATLSREELQKLLAGCTSVRDRLLVEFFRELGSRRGEIAALRIKDIQFDQHSPIVWLRGKTGERRRRVYVSKIDLIRYLEDHPYRDNANAPLWMTGSAKPLQYEGIYKIISKLGWRVLKRQIFPHMLRHTKATDDAKRFTDSEMMKLYGWKTPDQVRVYAHLSMRDVDDHDLILHGIKPASDAECEWVI